MGARVIELHVAEKFGTYKVNDGHLVVPERAPSASDPDIRSQKRLEKRDKAMAARGNWFSWSGGTLWNPSALWGIAQLLHIAIPKARASEHLHCAGAERPFVSCSKKSGIWGVGFPTIDLSLNNGYAFESLPRQFRGIDAAPKKPWRVLQVEKRVPDAVFQFVNGRRRRVCECLLGLSPNVLVGIELRCVAGKWCR